MHHDPSWNLIPHLNIYPSNCVIKLHNKLQVLVHYGQVNRKSVNIDTRYLPSSRFFFREGGTTSQFDWPIAPKKMKLRRLLKTEGSVLMYIVSPLRPTYIGERRITFAKAYGIKVRCLYGEHVEEHIVNLGNILGTH
jgi:hypothetical protein